MPKLHLANTFFEWELAQQPSCGLDKALHSHPIALQLQFLAALYTEGAVLVSEPPGPEYEELLRAHEIPCPQWVGLNSKEAEQYTTLESWGPSQIVARWADKRGISYLMPHWTSVVESNSKAFSFAHSPQLPHAALLEDVASVHKWVHSFPGKKVLKKCFGLSGAGHLLCEEDVDTKRVEAFVQQEFERERPVIGEPWVERVCDFSTQWEISTTKEIIYIGATLCHNDAKGQYQGTTVGAEPLLFGTQLAALETHKQTAHTLLQQLIARHFFGNVGIDAFLYHWEGSTRLHPLVEINARKTMGWAALRMQQRFFPHETIQVRYTKVDSGLLPQRLGKIHFSRNLTVKKSSPFTINTFVL